MFSLQYTNDAGEPQAARGDDGAPWACRHASTARSTAKSLAAMIARPVQVLRAGTVSYVVEPNGATRPPDGAETPDRALCVRDSGRACFCVPCRAERDRRA